MAVTIPVKTQYDPKGVKDAERDLKRLQQEQIRATRQQIAEHRKVQQLTAKLDRDLAGKRRGGGLGDVAGAFGVQLVAANALRDIVTLQKDFIEQSIASAAAAERLGTATENMGRQYGVAGRAIVESIQAASQGTISQVNAMRAANQAMLLGVAKNEEEFSELARIAVVLGRAMGQDANKSIEDLTIGIGRQSRLILDNLGLMVNAEAAYQRYATSIGKSVDELTEAEKKQAFLNATLEQGRAKVDQLGDVQLDAAGKIERLTAKWADFQIEFGEVLLQLGDAGTAEGVTNFIDKLEDGAKAWQDVIKNYNLLAEAQGRLEKESKTNASALQQNLDTANDWINTINPLNGLLTEAGELVGAYAFQNDALAEKVQEVAQEERDRAAAAEAAAKASAAAAKAAEEEAAALEHLAKVNEARTDIAAKLIDIDEKAAKDTAETWDDYFKEEAGAWQDHSKAVEKINADSEKERVQIQKDLAKSLLDIDKDLAKDLAKVDKDLAKDKAKAQRDSEKQIGRMMQDAARQEKRERRQRQIDAKGDQRLFDFEMRQLAAEGEFNAILAAKERRRIEQQIAAEKSVEEDRQQREDSRLEIDRARQDARDRLAEMEAEAEERKQMLQEQAEEQRAAAIEQAVEEEARRQEELAQALADEEANYQERLEARRQARDEKLAAIEEEKEMSAQKLAEELANNKDLTRAEMEAMIPMVSELGLNIGESFAEGINRGFAKSQHIQDLVNDAITTTSGKINPAHPTTSTNIGAKSKPNPYKSIYGFADGGAFTVGGAGGTDSQLVQFLATPGERVTVTPPSQGGGSVFNINVNGPGGRELAAIIQRKVEEGVNEYHTEVIVPWSNGN